VVCISGGLKDYYVNQFSEISGSSESVEIRGQNLSEKILVAHDGVDIAKFDIEVSKIDARKKTNLPQDKKIICYIGSSKTMGIEKGIDDAIQSLKHLDDEFVLVLVGIDEKSFESNDAALLRFLKNRVIFTGRVLREDVPLYLKASDVLIAPFPDKEHYMYYMSPLKIFEYMVSLRPIVVSLLPSVREVLSDKNSILVKPGDSGRLAMGIYKAVYEEDLADKISKQARSDVENYTWTKRAGKIMEFIASHK
jgi:glycosyltransferase involved in cell wall biosynthesis